VKSRPTPGMGVEDLIARRDLKTGTGSIGIFPVEAPLGGRVKKGVYQVKLTGNNSNVAQYFRLLKNSIYRIAKSSETVSIIFRFTIIN